MGRPREATPSIRAETTEYWKRVLDMVAGGECPGVEKGVLVVDAIKADTGLVLLFN